MFIYGLCQSFARYIALYRAAPNEDRGYPRKVQKLIKDLRVESGFGGEFLPESSLVEVVDQIDFHRLLPTASEDLIAFIKRKAIKVFLTALLSIDITGPELVVVAKTFQRNGLTDKRLPIKDISKPGRCLHPDSVFQCTCSKCSSAREKGKTECPHHPALDSFHAKEWSHITFDNFRRIQWTFCAPVFKKHSFQQFKKGLPKETVLPFTLESPNALSGHFSKVFHIKVHAAHQKGHDLNGSDGLSVALKELQYLPSEEVDYDVEAAWKQETNALEETRQLEDNHLINPISAFKRGQTHYIMLEWANGGTLRHLWDRTSDVHLHLNRQRIGEYLDQLCGLAGALQKLHGTNAQTATGLAEADIKNRASSNSGHRLSNLRFNVDNADTPQTYSLNTGSGSRIVSSAVHMPMLVLPEDDRDGSVKHWRHGDIKPENILIFKDSTWIGTLKIADLGLAKQHQFATEDRHQPTSTKHTTLHYEAPEAVTNIKEPRSRRYDVWSMGCIILESIIWLLYGSNGLDEFYRERSRLTDYSRQTLYFTATSQPTVGGFELIANVSDIASHWIMEMLEKDPECQAYTAFRQLLELVKNKLLVVPIPSKSKPRETGYRATSGDLYKEIENIRRTAEADEEYLFTGTDRRNVKAPSPLYARNENRTQQKATRPQDHLGIEVPLRNGSSQRALNTYRHVNLDNTWDFSEDTEIASHIVAGKGFITGCTTKSTTSTCERCLSFDFESPGLIAREDLSLLKSRADSCALCELLLGMFSMGKVGTVEIWRVPGGLGKYQEGSPDLCIYRMPLNDEDSDIQGQKIPIGRPNLPDISNPTYFEIMRQWLRTCDDGHRSCRVDSAESTPLRLPTRLIDVGDKDAPKIQLLESEQIQGNHILQFRYIALSHPWGDRENHTHYFTTRQNIQSYKTGIDTNILPETLRNAIYVTRELGVRYLWIDSLCIIQGEDGDFDEEAAHMETVFSTAYCVIAATRAKGSSSGFFGTRTGRKAVKLERPGRNPIYICKSIDNFQQDVIDGSLNKRGWVLQERALARRTIYFAENQNYWECGKGVRCETLTRMRNNQADLLGDPNFPKVATESSKGGRIRLYELLYKQYSRLQFTRISDRPLAIAGLEQRLIRAFDTQGGYGVFTRYFGRSLLWKRDVTLAPMKPIQFPKSQKYQVPSWSWMAYEGAINFMDLPFGQIDWEEREIRSPWNSQSPNSSSKAAWFTTSRNKRIDLTVMVRDFLPSADKGIIYDRGERPDNRVVKCVIVGRQKMKARVDGARIHYVLVVARKVGPGYDARYERIGVGALPGSSITLERTGEPGQVF